MQNITEKILEEAKKETKEITKKYQEEAKKIKEVAEAKWHLKKREIELDLEKMKKAEKVRALAREKLFLNKKLTMEKQQYINEIIRRALNDLPEHKEYLNFLKSLINKSGEKAGELLITKKDQEKYGTQLEKFMKDQGLSYRISIAESITGGIILKKEKKTYLGATDLIGELLKDELAIEISKIIYK